jgi:hypothetical protein
MSIPSANERRPSEGALGLAVAASVVLVASVALWAASGALWSITRAGVAWITAIIPKQTAIVWAGIGFAIALLLLAPLMRWIDARSRAAVLLRGLIGCTVPVLAVALAAIVFSAADVVPTGASTLLVVLYTVLLAVLVLGWGTGALPKSVITSARIALVGFALWGGAVLWAGQFLAAFVAGVLLLASAGAGQLVLASSSVRFRSPLEEVLARIALGLTAWMVAALFAGMVSLLTPWLVAVALGAAVYFGVIRSWSEWEVRLRAAVAPTAVSLSGAVLALVVLCALGVTLVANLGPEWSSDALGARLSAPVHFARMGSVTFIPEIWSTYTQIGAEVLYTLAVVLGDAAAAKQLHYAAGIVSLGLVFVLARDLGGPLAAAFALATIATSSIVWWQLGTGYTDLLVLLFGLASALALLTWLRQPTAGLLALFSAFAGAAAAVKLTGAFLFIAALPVVLPSLLGRSQRSSMMRNLLALSAPAAVAVLPFTLRTWVKTGNPVFPFLSNIFPSPYWPDSVAHIGIRFTPGNSVFDYLSIPWIAIYEPGRLIEGGQMALALLPLLVGAVLWILSAFREQVERRFAIFVILASALWILSDTNLRYGLVQLALVVILGAAGLVRAVDAFFRARMVVVGAMVVTLVAGVPFMLATAFWYAGISSQGFPYRAVFRGERDVFLSVYYPQYPAIAYLNRTYGSEAKVWAPTHRDFLYPEFSLVWADSSMGQQKAMRVLRQPTLAFADLHGKLRGMGFTHLLLDETSIEHNGRPLRYDARGVFAAEWVESGKFATIEYAYNGVLAVRLAGAGAERTTRVGTSLVADARFQTLGQQGSPWVAIGQPTLVQDISGSASVTALRVDGANMALQEVPVQEGTLYRLSMSARCEPGVGAGRREISWRDAAGRALNNWFSLTFDCAPVYRPQVMYETAPPGAVKAVIMLRTGTQAPMMVEEVSFSPVLVGPVDKTTGKPRDIGGELGRARELVNAGNRSAARPILEQLIEVASDNAEVNYLLAIVLRDEGVQRQRAVGLFNAALGLGFDEFWVRYNRGVLLRDMGDRERAAEDFSVAAGMRPDFKFAVDAARSLAKLP